MNVQRQNGTAQETDIVQEEFQKCRMHQDLRASWKELQQEAKRTAKAII